MEQQDINQLKVMICSASVGCLAYWKVLVLLQACYDNQTALTAISLLLCQVVRFWAQHLTRLATAFTAVSQTVWSPLAAMTAHMHNHMPLIRYYHLFSMLLHMCMTPVSPQPLASSDFINPFSKWLAHIGKCSPQM